LEPLSSTSKHRIARLVDAAVSGPIVALADLERTRSANPVHREDGALPVVGELGHDPGTDRERFVEEPNERQIRVDQPVVGNPVRLPRDVEGCGRLAG
jgi:hypothetical protein